MVNARGYCRLCSRQANLVRPPHESIDVCEANRNGQQLFIADLFRAKRPIPLPPVTTPVVWPERYPVSYRQQLLFEAEPDLRAGFPPPPLADLATALDHAVHEHGAKHGWGHTLVVSTCHGIHVLLGLQSTPGAQITFSEARLLSQLPTVSVQPVVEILSAAGMLDDDREPPLQSWLASQTQSLAEPMATEVRQWFLILRDGSVTPPRSRPRALSTTRQFVASVTPALRAWTDAGHHSLREISREDITAVLPTDVNRRRQMISALRSLFRLLKARRVVFVNPTARLSGGPVPTNQPLPLDLDVLRQAINRTDPARSALAALIAFHAPRMQQLRDLELTNIRDGHLFVAGQTILLAPPVRERLSTWLDERARRWPNTVNPHLFVNHYTAVRTSQVSKVWISATLGIRAKDIRNDRILHEAIATQGDIRRLCDLFGISVLTALRYTHTTERPEPPEPTVGSAT
ncbi:MAG: hypothetical protein ACYDB7_11800 [Mycobacteriales bacterium]